MMVKEMVKEPAAGGRPCDHFASSSIVDIYIHIYMSPR